MTQQEPSNTSRRRFLKGAAAGTALAGIGAAAATGYRLSMQQRRPADDAPQHANAPPVAPELLTHRPAEVLPTGLDQPRAIAWDSARGVLYVAGDQAIARLTRAGAAGARWPLEGAPTAVSVAPDGGVLTAMAGAVRFLSPDGATLASWPAPRSGMVLTALAGRSDGSVFLADAAHRVVLCCDARGRPATILGEDGKHFVVPSPYFDLALDADGVLWVGNPGRHRVERYAADGRLTAQWGAYGPGVECFCGCCNPSYVAVWPVAARRGRLAQAAFLTSEKGFGRVKLHDHAGAIVGVVTADLACGAAAPASDGAFPRPIPAGCRSSGFDVAATDDGTVFVLDPGARVVRTFTPVPAAGAT